MRRAAELVAIASLTLTALAAQAEPFTYAVSDDLATAPLSSQLLQIDLATGTTTRVGRIGFVDVEGLAMAPDGTLYGVEDKDKTLITIDTSFGRGTAVGTGVSNMGLTGTGITNVPLDLGLTFSCDGRLWMSSDTTGKFWEVNRNTGQARLVGVIGANVSGLAGTADGVYGISVSAPQGLYKINLETGAGTRVGNLGNTSPFVDAGMDVDSTGRVWAVLDYNPPPESRPGDLGKQSDLVRVDTQTGAITYVSKTYSDVEGLAIGRPPACAVPAPNVGNVSVVPVNATQAMALLAMMMVAFGLVCFRRIAD